MPPRAKPIEIGTRRIGPGGSVFLIAEIGVNHNGDPDRAAELVREAKKAGADCVKFQTFSAERVVTEYAPKASYQTRVTDPHESQIDMLRKLELAADAHKALLLLCKEQGVVFCSTPYNEEDIEFLDRLGTPILKAASMHLAEPHFLKRMAETGRPMIVSTGMATGEEVDRAVDAIRSTGNDQFVLLQCTTNYPSSLQDANLRAMVAFGDRHMCLTGYSDHTQEQIACLGAVALGASVIEKHFTIDRALPGPDHMTSETPAKFAALADAIRAMESALGMVEKRPSAAEASNMEGMRRSLVARQKILAGQAIRDEDLICKRPSTGIEPRHWENLVGKIARCDVEEGTMLRWTDVDV